MEFTNKAQLPDALYHMLTYNDYNVGGPKFDISATKLIDSPLIAQLWREHGKDVSEEASTRLYSAMGTGIHSRLEVSNASNPNVLMEKRFLATFPHPKDGNDDLIVSGQIDVYDFKTRTLADLKTVSAWKIVKQDFGGYEKQLNVGAYLMSVAGFQIDKLEVYALIRDWSRARQSEKDYPAQPIEIIDIPLWSTKEQHDFIAERLEVHFGDSEKFCSDAERWARPATFAVKESGKKRALRVLPSKEKAESWIESQGLSGSKKISIEERPAVYGRCEGYCAFGSMGVCPQYKTGE